MLLRNLQGGHFYWDTVWDTDRWHISTIWP